MRRLIVPILAAISVAACAPEAPKALILYYSQTGATEAVAMELQKQTGADIERFDVAEPYDGDFNATIDRVMGEKEAGYIPELVPLKADVSGYDIIYLGYPIWFGTYAPPVKSLLAAVDFAGKKIVPFCTFGSGGLLSSCNDLKAALTDSEIVNGYGVRNARIQRAAEELDRFLIESGLKPGNIDPLPEYSAQDILISDEAAIYEEAVAGYPFPIGEAVSVGSRTVPGGTDYLFTVRTVSADGAERTGKVYVSCRDGQKAEFTSVDR